MLLASKKLNIPQYCYHDPIIKNSYGSTVAMCIAWNGIIPDMVW